MSVNTSEEYLDELLQAIEPIIGTDKPQEISQPEAVELAEPVDDNADMNELLAALSEEASKEVGQLDEGTELLSDVEGNVEPEAMPEMTIPEVQDEVSGAEEDADVKALLEQFTSEDGFAEIEEIQEAPSISDLMQEEPEPEKLEPQLEEQQVAVPLEEAFEEPVEEGKDTYKERGEHFHFFKKKKSKKGKEESNVENEEVIPEKEDVPQETESLQDSANLMEKDLLSGLMGEDVSLGFENTGTDSGVEEVSLNDLFAQGDTMDIDALLSAGSFEGNSEASESAQDSSEKGKKVSLFSKLFTLLTEEEEEDEKETKAKKSSVPESAATGITDENETILEELSKEEKKKRKKEEKERKKKEKEDKKKNKGKDSDASADENDEKAEKEEEAKKKKKKPKKEKPRKVEDIDAKPAKKISKKKIFIVFAFCFSILAMILILQTVVLEVSNARQARWAFDNADYETCYANLYGVERSEEEEEIFQKSYIVLCMQRKWDSYENLKQMDMGVEALNALFEGIRLYRDDMEVKAESYGIVSRISPIYDMMYSELGAYGLSDADIEEIIAYESKVSYTKRLESIVNGTPFVENEWLPEPEEPVAEESTGVKSDIVTTPGDINITEPLEDVLPMEEEFLSEEDGATKQNSQAEETEQDTTETVQELPEEKVQHTTTVVGSSPVNINDSVQ